MDIHKYILKHADKEKAKLLSGFFKTGKGEYGEGDVFIGIMVPISRKIAKEFLRRKDSDVIVSELLHSKFHEERLIALLMLVDEYQNCPEKREGIVKLYLGNTKYINNWDLVDLSAPRILGEYLLRKDRKLLDKLSSSRSLWERRIAILSTFAFIKNGEFDDSLRIAENLMADKHDLIHKAIGWMLREVGKKDVAVLKVFLRKHHKMMPRTMLRYAIERFPESERRRWLSH